MTIFSSLSEQQGCLPFAHALNPRRRQCLVRCKTKCVSWCMLTFPLRNHRLAERCPRTRGRQTGGQDWRTTVGRQQWCSWLRHERVARIAQRASRVRRRDCCPPCARTAAARLSSRYPALPYCSAAALEFALCDTTSRYLRNDTAPFA